MTQRLTGAQRVALEVTLGLKKRFGRDALVLAPIQAMRSPWFEALEVRPVGYRTGVLWEQRELPKFLKTMGSPFLVNLVNAAPLAYHNQLVTIHDLAWLHMPESLNIAFRHWYQFLIPRVMSRSQVVVTVSDFSKTDIQKHFPKVASKVYRIYNGNSLVFSFTEENPEFYKKTTTINENKPEKEIKNQEQKGVTPNSDQVLRLKRLEVENLREDWSPSHKPFIFTVGTLQPYKNLKTLLKAFRILKTEYAYFSDWELCIAGGSNTKIFSRKLGIDQNLLSNNVHFLGYLDHETLRGLYQKATIFVFPSLFEGFGLPLVEAMASGCPVISSCAGALPEIGGDACEYFDPHSPEELVGKIKQIASSSESREILRKKGQSRARIFDWRETVEQYSQLILKNLS